MKYHWPLLPNSFLNSKDHIPIAFKLFSFPSDPLSMPWGKASKLSSRLLQLSSSGKDCELTDIFGMKTFTVLEIIMNVSLTMYVVGIHIKYSKNSISVSPISHIIPTCTTQQNWSICLIMVHSGIYCSFQSRNPTALFISLWLFYGQNSIALKFKL